MILVALCKIKLRRTLAIARDVILVVQQNALNRELRKRGKQNIDIIGQTIQENENL